MSNEYRIYASSLEYVTAEVDATLAGAPFDPTGDTVEMAFIPLDQVEPGGADWVAASWETVGSGLTVRYLSKCLVGPAGATTLAPGLYQVFVRVQDVPEIPVKQAATLLRVE